MTPHRCPTCAYPVPTPGLCGVCVSGVAVHRVTVAEMQAAYAALVESPAQAQRRRALQAPRPPRPPRPAPHAAPRAPQPRRAGVSLRVWPVAPWTGGAAGVKGGDAPRNRQQSSATYNDAPGMRTGGVRRGWRERRCRALGRGADEAGRRAVVLVIHADQPIGRDAEGTSQAQRDTASGVFDLARFDTRDEALGNMSTEGQFRLGPLQSFSTSMSPRP